MWWRVLMFTILVGGVVCPFSGATEAQLYWVNPDSGLMKSRLDGSDATVILGLANEVSTDLAIDEAAGKLYWTEYNYGELKRANLDGTGLEVLLDTDLTHPKGVALDAKQSKIYWCNQDFDTIERANLDGSGRETLVTDAGVPQDIEVDTDEGQLFWTAYEDRAIYRTDLDGSNRTTIITGQTSITGLAIAPVSGRLYWSLFHTFELYSARLDGSGLQQVLQLPGEAQYGFSGLAIDEISGKLYIHNSADTSHYRCNLDGTDVENLGAGAGHGIALIANNFPLADTDNGHTAGNDQPYVVAGPGLLANDSDEDGDVLTVSEAVVRTSYGALVTLRADGGFTYDPSGSVSLIMLLPGESVVDSFSYEVTDGNGGVDVGEAEVIVSGVNSPPPVPISGWALGLLVVTGICFLLRKTPART